MKKKSVLVLILISFWLMYSTVTIGTYIVQSRKSYESEINRRKGLIDYYLDLSAHFLMNNKVQALIPRLDRARDLREFDFYLLRKNGEVLAYYNKNNDLSGINYDYKVIDEFQETDDLSLKTIAIYDFKLTIGIVKAEGSFLWDMFNARRNAIVQDLILVTSLVFLIVYLLLKDILDLSQILQSRSRKSLSSVHSRSKEAEVLLQATGGYEKSNEELRGDNLLLASNLGPAIRDEIRSGKPTPYDFPCTLARVDLNGYTQMFLQKDPKDLLFLLNQYFQKSRDLIERYEGLIYQYVGDETIFLFKGEDSAKTAIKALATIRSLFEMAVDLKTEGLPQGLRLKASLVTGRLQFVKLDDGHAFSGLPLIESVRMLGQVSEKTENCLLFYADSLPTLSPFCEVSASKTLVFKGFQHESHILEAKHFTSLSQAMKSLPLNQIGEFFRGDQDLTKILSQLESFIQSNDENSFLNLLAPLRDMRVRRVNSGVIDAYQNLLKTCLDLKQDQSPESRTLATVVSLSQNLLQPDQVSSPIRSLLDQCEGAQDPRVQANTLIAKSFLGLEIRNLTEKMASTSNRLSADAILVSGRRDFNQLLADRVENFLESQNPRFVASALFLVAELIQYYHQQDRVYLMANSPLRALAQRVPEYLDHSDVMIQARAQKSYQQIARLGMYEN